METAPAAAAGGVDFAVGDAHATGPDGRARALAKGAELDAGDRILTNQARVQIRSPTARTPACGRPTTLVGHLMGVGASHDRDRRGRDRVRPGRGRCRAARSIPSRPRRRSAIFPLALQQVIGQSEGRTVTPREENA